MESISQHDGEFVLYSHEHAILVFLRVAAAMRQSVFTSLVSETGLVLAHEQQQSWRDSIARAAEPGGGSIVLGTPDAMTAYIARWCSIWELLETPSPVVLKGSGNTSPALRASLEKHRLRNPPNPGRSVFAGIAWTTLTDHAIQEWYGEAPPGTFTSSETRRNRPMVFVPTWDRYAMTWHEYSERLKAHIDRTEPDVWARIPVRDMQWAVRSQVLGHTHKAIAESPSFGHAPVEPPTVSRAVSATLALLAIWPRSRPGRPARETHRTVIR